MSSGKCGHDPAKHILKSPPRVPGSDPLALGNPCFHTLSCWFHLVKSRRQHSLKKKYKSKQFPNHWLVEKKASAVSPTAATFYFYKSFWSLLRSQALETPQLGFRELNGRKSCWPFSGTLLTLTWLCTKASQTFSGSFSGTFSGTLLNLTWLCKPVLLGIIWKSVKILNPNISVIARDPDDFQLNEIPSPWWR